HDDDARVGSPRTAEAEARGCRFAGWRSNGFVDDARVGDDVSGRLRFGGARLGGDLAVADLVDDGVVEDGGGIAEDEVDASCDVAVEVVLAAEVGEEGVLVAQKSAMFEY